MKVLGLIVHILGWVIFMWFGIHFVALYMNTGPELTDTIFIRSALLLIGMMVLSIGIMVSGLGLYRIARHSEKSPKE